MWKEKQIVSKIWIVLLKFYRIVSDIEVNGVMFLTCSDAKLRVEDGN